MRLFIFFTSLLALVFQVQIQAQAQSEIQLRIVGGSGIDQGNTILISDNGTYILGSTSSDGTGNVRGYVVFYDSNMDFAWSLLTPYGTPVEQIVDGWVNDYSGTSGITLLSQRLGINGTYNMVMYNIDNLGDEGLIVSSHEFTHSDNQQPVAAIHWRGFRWAVGASEGDGFLMNIDEPFVGQTEIVLDTWGHSVRTETVESATVFGDTLYVTGTTEINGIQQSTIWAWGAEGEPIWARIQPDIDTYEDNFARDLAVNEERLTLLYSFKRPSLPIGHGVIALDKENGTPSFPVNTSANIFVDGCKLEYYGDQLVKLAHIDFGANSGTDIVVTWLGTFGGYIDSGVLGTDFDEKPSDMKIDEEGQIWILGSTKGFLNGAQSICLYRLDSLNVIPSVNDIAPGLAIKNDPLFQSISGISDFSNSSQLSLYPNPVKSSSVIQINGVSDSTPFSYTVYNSLGVVCLKGEGTDIPTNNLSPGSYFISIDLDIYRATEILSFSIID